MTKEPYEIRRFGGERKARRLDYAGKLRSVAKQIRDMNSWAENQRILLTDDVFEDLATFLPFATQLEDRAIEVERPSMEEAKRKWDFGTNRHDKIQRGETY